MRCCVVYCMADAASSKEVRRCIADGWLGRGLTFGREVDGLQLHMLGESFLFDWWVFIFASSFKHDAAVLSEAGVAT